MSTGKTRVPTGFPGASSSSLRVAVGEPAWSGRIRGSFAGGTDLGNREKPSVPDKTALPRCQWDPANRHCNLRASFLLSPPFFFFLNQLNPLLENHIENDSLLTSFKKKKNPIPHNKKSKPLVRLLCRWPLC